MIMSISRSQCFIENENGASSDETEENEKTKLLQEVEKANGEETDKINLSLGKQRLMLITVLTLQFGSLCADTAIFPFFPAVARKKGLTEIEIGLVFSSYEFSRFAAYPVYCSLVRI